MNQSNQTTSDNFKSEVLAAFDRLLNIMNDLREKCPWDRKQTMKSLRNMTLEEAYELSDAILNDDLEEVKNELGDLLLHIIFYSKIGQEEGVFDIKEVLNQLCEKLIRRHPHVYGDVKLEDSNTVKKNWEKIKLNERGGSASVLEGLPKAAPALSKAIWIQEKVKGVGFDWNCEDPILDKIQEEITEFVIESDAANKVIEFGDILFSLVNYARFKGIDPEEALTRTNKKFVKRFQTMELEAKEQGKNLIAMRLEEMEKFWEKAKYLKK